MDVDLNAEGDYKDLEQARKKGLFGRFNRSLNESLQASRGGERVRDAAVEASAAPTPASADDLALRRAKSVTAVKMVIPEGVVIQGSLTGGADTEIGGKIEGNVTVAGRVFIGETALISGNVSAASCRVDGMVEGKVECSDELELGPKGNLKADVAAGKRINVAGRVYGNVMSHGVVRLLQTCVVEGDVRARSVVMEEGAQLNGRCVMRPPAQPPSQQEAKKK
jgi:cytoskeletal protein CcmA (bactofilin family)